MTRRQLEEFHITPVSAADPRDFHFTVRAASYEEAAQIAVHKRYPYVRGLSALRTTGDAGLSGCFLGYVPGETGGSSSAL